jgi:hypothetical protein
MRHVVTVFTLGSGICSVAMSEDLLIAGQGVQGMRPRYYLRMMITDVHSYISISIKGTFKGLFVIVVSDLVPLHQHGDYMTVILAINGIGTTMGHFVGSVV